MMQMASPFAVYATTLRGVYSSWVKDCAIWGMILASFRKKAGMQKIKNLSIKTSASQPAVFADRASIWTSFWIWLYPPIRYVLLICLKGLNLLGGIRIILLIPKCLTTRRIKNSCPTFWSNQAMRFYIKRLNLKRIFNIHLNLVK